jgi:mannose/fructose-specific phosphotransferase system component IIA
MKSEPQFPLPAPAPMAGVIVTHGDVARALRDAARQIAGDVRNLEIVSNEGASLDQLTGRVRDALAGLDGQACIVFVDFRGGSSANAALRAVAGLDRVRVVAGVNLPMVLDFVLRRGDYDLDAMVARLVQRGQTAVQPLKAC